MSTYRSKVTGRPIEVDDDDFYDAWKDGEVDYRGQSWEQSREDRETGGRGRYGDLW